MNRSRIILATGLLALVGMGGCVQEETPQYTAFLSHPASLPQHRYMDERDSAHRQFMALQRPGDRLLMADHGMSLDSPGLRRLEISDRPLQASRQIRMLHGVMNEYVVGQEFQLASNLDDVARYFNEASERPRCLYLLINPTRQAPPLADQDLWPVKPSVGGWTAVLIVPDPEDNRLEPRLAWMEQLHLRGAGRIKTTRIDAPLPSCRE